MQCTYMRRVPTRRNFIKYTLGRFDRRVIHPDGTLQEVKAEGLPALIMAAGAAFGISALWGIIQAFAQ